MSTPQTQAEFVLAQLNSCAEQLATLGLAIQEAQSLWTLESVANEINAMATCSVNADGSLGTPDGTPNVTHPIDIRVLTGVPRALSANQWAALETVLGTVVSLIAGNAVSAQTSMNAILNETVGG